MNVKAERLRCLPFRLPFKTPERFVMFANAKLRLGAPFKFQLQLSVMLEVHVEGAY
jgi:hypothetical protein